MRKIFEFVKIAKTWFYWKPEYDGNISNLRMAGDLLDSIGEPFIRLQMVDKATAEIHLTLLDDGLYMCRSKYYSGKLYIPKEMFNDRNIYLSNV